MNPQSLFPEVNEASFKQFFPLQVYSSLVPLLQAAYSIPIASKPIAFFLSLLCKSATEKSLSTVTSRLSQSKTPILSQIAALFQNSSAGFGH